MARGNRRQLEMTKSGSILPHLFWRIDQLYTFISLLSTGISGLHPFAHSAEFSFLRVGIGYSLLSTGDCKNGARVLCSFRAFKWGG